MHFNRKAQFDFSFNCKETFLSGSDQFLITKSLDTCWGDFVYEYDQN